MSVPRFEKIYEFDFGHRSAKKLYNSSYLEEVTSFLSKVSSKIDSKEHYYFDNKYYLDSPDRRINNSFKQFVKDFKNSFYANDNNRIHIILGAPGTGKTLFFEKGIPKLIRKGTGKERRDYIKFGVDFKNIDQKNSIQFYEDYIYNNLYDNAIDAILQLDAGEAFAKFTNEKKKFEPIQSHPRAKLLPVLFFCDAIYETFKNPCIILFDNIDLSCAETQINVFKAAGNVCDKLNKYVKNNSTHTESRFCAYFAVRPENFARYHEVEIGQTINFPLPNILTISIAALKDSLIETAEEYDKKNELNYEFSYYNILSDSLVKVKKYMDIADYFNKVIEHYLIGLWKGNVVERLGTSEQFHCDITGCNVRTYLKFLSDTISNGGFKPLTENFKPPKEGCQKSRESSYTVFDYIEMIIRGRWEVHPGNKLIDGEGGNKAPIVFHLFDSTIWNNTQEDKIKHFMLYIRILQYFAAEQKDENIRYGYVERDFKKLFDTSHLKNAIKRLIHVRILYSFDEGEEAIRYANDYSDITVNENTRLELSPLTGYFYIEKFICEFEYLYQVSLSSLMNKEYIDEFELKSKHMYEKELTVLCFLKSIYDILKINLTSYSDAEFEHFKMLFCKDDAYGKPYRRMVNAFIQVMNNKVNAAKSFSGSRLQKLLDIEKQAIELQETSENYFSSRLNK